MSFLLLINEGAIVTDIREVPLEQIASVKKWERSNGESFPAFNIPALFRPESSAGETLIRELREKIKKGEQLVDDDIERVLYSSLNNWTIVKNRKAEVDRIENCLKRATREVVQQLANVPHEYSSIKELCGRARRIQADSLHDSLRGIVLNKLLGTPDQRYIDILFGTSRFQVVLELYDWAQEGYQYPANHREVQSWMNKRFLETDRQTKGSSTNTDAFGEDAAGMDEQKYPEVRLPVLGNVKLRSMFKDIPAQTRYGMIEAESFPAGYKARKEMKSAIEWLSQDARKGKTWCNLTKSTDKTSLLFAYPTEMPAEPPELAGLLGGVDDYSGDPDGARFLAIAQRVTVALQGIARSSADSDVRIFVLTKMDKARTKVLASRRYTANHMIDSAEMWQEGCKNIPVIKIRQSGKEKGDILWAEPLVPFPAELIWCLNTAWRRQGTYVEAVHGYSMNDGLSLLLDISHEVRRLAARAIDTIVRNSAPLLLAVGQQNHFARVFKVDQGYSKQLLLLSPILGLLLDKLDYVKGEYVSSPAFLIGRFMSLADKLHLRYCEDVRKGSIPPQLVGNALMATALEEPVKALSMLSQRILPYQAWANTLKEGESIGLVRYFLNQLGEASDKLNELEIPTQCSDADKAQMLLGYLAWSERTSD